MKIQWKKLIPCILVPLAVGGVSAWLTNSSMEQFEKLVKPPLSPPGWLFPIVWTILFILMGIASYLAAVSNGTEKEITTALVFYGAQLFFNFFWTIIFFNRNDFLFAFIWLLALWALILTTTVLFFKLSKAAGWLMIPYLLWVTFAAYLNFAIYLLN